MKLLSLLLAAAVLCPAPAAAQTVTSVGTSAVAPANDFATQTFQDPWDMNERTDLGWFLYGTDQPGSGFSSVNFANGVFSGTTSGGGNFFLLESGNPNAARVGKFGLTYPIAANTYRLMAFRMSTSSGSSTFFQWNRETIYDTTTTRSNTINTQPGYGFYLADLPTFGTVPIGTPAPFPWGGTVKSLWMFSNSAGTVLLDWVRLVDVQPSLCRTITWTGPSTVDIYLDNNNVASDGNLGPIALTANAGGASPGCSGTTGNTYRYYAGALPAGTYHVGVVSSGGSTANLNYGNAVTPWVVNDTPTLTFTSPSEEGSDDDFATTQLGNPWDMNAVSDFDLLTNVTNPHLENMTLETPAGVALGVQRVFRATSVHGASDATANTTIGDPYLDPLFVTKRGFNTRIDTNRYRILTFEFGVPNRPRNILDGSIARIVWRVSGEAAENVSNDIIFSSRSGANVLNKVTVDMEDRTALSLEAGSPSGWQNGSTNKPGLDIFRVDPHEFTAPTDFFIRRIKLAALEKTNGSYTIRWTFSEPSGTVDLYWDDDSSGFDGTLIQNNVDAAAGRYTWNASGFATTTPTNYYIYAIFEDSSGASNRVYAKWPIVIDSTYRALPRIVLNRSTLNFGVTSTNVITGPQVVRVTVVGSGSPCWTVDNTGPSADFIVTNGSGCGNGSFTVAIKSQNYFANGTGETTLRVRNTSATNTFENSPQYIHAFIRISSAGTVPVGAVDTPPNGAVSGSVPVTGWVVDDIDVTSVKVFRSPVAGEPGDVFIGDAVRVDDARTDVESAFPNSPFNYRAGWGYLMLSNFLPNGGNGNFVLKVYATDREGHRTLLGSRSIVGQNSAADRPFGAIDTPLQGETVSGTIPNFGWVLARTALASPGSSPAATVTVVVDGVGIGTPAGWTSRDDLTRLFPGYPGVDKALGVFGLDTTVYENGVHTIAWGVTADNLQSDGIGSRYFNIVNGSASLTLARGGDVLAAPSSLNSGPDLGRRAADVASLDMNTSIVSGHTYGYRPAAQRVEADASGRRVVFGHEIERVVVDASSAAASRYEAYSVVDGQLRVLPTGASFDSSRGILYWQPGVGYIGNYDFVILTSGNKRIPVRIVLQPQRSRPRPLGRSWNFASAAEPDHVLRARSYVLQSRPSL